MPKIEIHTLDSGPDELAAQLPIRAQLLRKLPGPDEGDYTLAELAAPISSNRNGTVREIRYIIVGPHLRGASFKPGNNSIALNSAYVIDERQLNEPKLDFAKAEYVAIGFAAVSWSVRQIDRVP